MRFPFLNWIRKHKWRLLLAGIISLLVISPISEVYDNQDNIITPISAVVFLAVILGTAEKKLTAWVLAFFIVVWLIISIATEGSGLFAGHSLLAPMLFMVLLGIVFTQLSRWLIRAVLIDTEVLCAAICGYLLLGILWTGLYALVSVLVSRTDPSAPAAFVSASPKVSFGDLLYFSYTTLTTTGYGDIIPKDPVIRMLAVIEAIVGVFYNTIVIARFVGLYGIGTRDLRPDQPAAPERD